MIDIKHIKNFCHKAIDITSDWSIPYNKGVSHQAKQTLDLIADLERIEANTKAKQEAFEKEIREKFGLEKNES